MSVSLFDRSGVRCRAIAVSALVFALGGVAHAGPAMFTGSLMQRAFGNDYTADPTYPFNSVLFTALPLGNRCGSASPYTTGSAPAPYYCSNATLQAGQPATGSGTLSLTTTGMGPVPFQLPQSAIVGAATGSLRPIRTGQPKGTPPVAGSYVFRSTSASFANETGSFFAGGGPGNQFFIYAGSHFFEGQVQITAGTNQFGGVMGLLGKIGMAGIYTQPGQSGQFAATHSWNLAKVVGRSTNTANQTNMYQATGKFQNTATATTETRTMVATGFAWTTGTVFARADVGAFTTSLSQAGYDNRTAMGIGNIQLVTPSLTHWIDGARENHTAQISVLKLHFVPEPSASLLALAGVSALAGLHAACRRGSRR